MADEVQAGAGADRRRFLKRAGVAAGAAWVAPLVVSQAAHAQSSGVGVARILFPPLDGWQDQDIGCGGALVLQRIGSPPPGSDWAVALQRTAPPPPPDPIPIEIVALELVSSSPITIVAPSPSDPLAPPLSPPFGIHGTGTPPEDSFFDITYRCLP